jgi:glycosyltransferase involved in cell wall biosynthesis
VLYVTSSGDTFGGAETVLFDVVTAPGVAEWEPLVVVPFEGGLATSLGNAGVECCVVEIGALRHRREARSPMLLLRLAAALVAGFRLSRLIRRRRVGLVHSNTSTVLAGAIAARLAGVAHVWHVREVLGGPAWSLLSRMILRFSDRVVCISESVASNLRGRLRGDRVVVIPDGVDDAVFRPPVERGTTGRVLMAARINPHKGHELFIRAAASIASRVPDARFEAVGGCLPVYEPLHLRLKNLVAELGLEDRFVFTDHLSRADVAERIRSCDVVVVPSTWVEPGGLVVLEAMATGTPVVATRRGGPAEVITDGEDGFLVSHTDPQELADTVTRLLGDTSLRSKIATAAVQRVQENYTLRLHVARLNSMYHEILDTDVGARCA